MPQVSSYIPAPQVAAPQVTYAAPTATVVETLAPQLAPTMATTIAAPVSYIPASMMEAAPQVLSYVQPQVEQMSGQSVIVEQVGDWLVCEDAMGIFYHHSPTQQSFDNAPAEFLMLFPGGYSPPPLGAFAQAPQAIMQAPAMAAPQVTYAAPQAAIGTMQAMPMAMPQAAPQVFMSQAPVMAAPMMETIVQGAQPVTYAAPQPVV